MEREQLEAQLAAGLTLAEMGRRAGTHPATVAYWLDRHDLPRPVDATHRPRGSLPRAQLSRLVAEDLTVREIAVAVDRSPTTVRYWLRRYELSTTPAARAKRRGAPRRVIEDCARHGRAEHIARRDRGLACRRCRQFHHRDPARKRFGLGSRGLARSIEDLREEAKKCVLLCANCHAMVEAGAARLPRAAARTA